MTTATPSKGVSVLASLTADVMREKKAEARKLTPVAGEVAQLQPAPALPRTQEMFPNDMPGEVVQQKAAELTRIIDHLTQSRDALLRLVELPLPSEVIDPVVAQKEAEKAADEKFAAEFAAKQEAAQTAVFAPVVAKWACPLHGKRTTKTSKTGVEFIGCPDCNLFKR